MSSNDTKALATVQLMSKNLGIGVFLTLFFGGIGLLYANLTWGLILGVVEIALVIVFFLTMGIGIVLLIPWHIVCVILTIVWINNHNKRLLSKL